MPHSYFVFNGAERRNPAAAFRATVEREFYRADAYLKGDLSSLELHYRKATVGALHIFKASFNGRAVCGVQRSWQDIRSDSKQFLLLWFPRFGTVCIHQNQQDEVVTADEFAITYANRPLHIETLPDASGRHESWQVAVPLHLVNPSLPSAESLGGRRFPLDSGNARMARKTFLSLFEDAESMTPKAVEAYVNTAIESLSEALRGECRKRVDEFDIKNVRLNKLRGYIDFHLSDPGLTAHKVASECGISQRYVHLLLREAGTTFRDQIWSRRLARAHEWLTSRETLEESISHVAYTTGFRSVSHFCRSFKAAYGCTPGQAREQAH